MENIREKAIVFLDQPTTKAGKAYAIFSLLLIFITIFHFVLETKLPDFITVYKLQFSIVENAVLIFIIANSNCL